jgi:hypothetical protein
MTTRTSLETATVPRAREHAGSRLGAPLWAMAGVTLLFAEPSIRLGARAARTVAAGLRPGEWVAFVVVCATLLYAEGHRALQRRLAPSVVARVLGLRHDRRRTAALLAPLHVLSLVHAEPRTLARAWLGAGLIAAAAASVRALPAPWRGIVDGGVALALLWGVVSIWVRFVSEARKPR